MQMQGKIAIVTGGTQGLGATIARMMAARGAAGLVICGRSEEKGQAVAESLECPAHFVRADLSNIRDCDAVISAADREFGRIDVLVNAAAVTDRGGILNTSPKLWDHMFAVNARAPFFLMQGAAKVMIREGTPGAMVNIGSVASYSGQPFIGAYCASKGALATMVRNTAFALMANRIRVNLVEPGWMATDGEDVIQAKYHGAGPDWREEAGKTLPFGRLVDPKEVAEAVCFLASDAAGLITGAEIPVDQSIRGAQAGAPPIPERPLTLADTASVWPGDQA